MSRLEAATSIGADAPIGAASGRSARDRWYPRISLAVVTVAGFALNAWGLAQNGLGNQYYAAATRSMSGSWADFFFASFDPGGFISVDKPPLFLWIDAVSARLFGINSWSLLLPSALAGAAAVAVLWCVIRRRFGVVAASIAGAVLALSPVSVAVNRLNLPEPFLVLFLVLAAWAALRALDDDRWVRWVVLAGAFVGLAFNTKMLAAYVPVPALGIALLVSAGSWGRRVGRALVFGASALLFSLPWIVAVDLTPAADRPFVGGSTDNTVRDLVFGYNGFGRVSGGSLGGGPSAPGAGGPSGAGPGAVMGGAGGVFGGSAGPFRLLSDALAGQIAWLLPLALFGAVAGLWRWRRDGSRRAAVVLWAGWLVLYGAVFSRAGGTFHAYYTSVMAPAVAALVGVGAVAVVALVRLRRWWLVPVGLVGAVTLGLQLVIAGRQPGYFDWLRPVASIGVALAFGVALVALVLRHRRLLLGALAGGLAALLVLPGAWAASETANPVLNATLPQAGPRTGSAGSTFGSASSNGDPELAAFLSAHRQGERWDLVVPSAQVGSGLMADQGISVMALGGFMGTDSAITGSAFADQVAAGQVRYVLVSGGDPRGGGPAPGAAGTDGAGFAARGARGAGSGAGPGRGGTASQILSTVASVCTAVPAGDGLPTRYQGSLYDCAARADALRP